MSTPSETNSLNKGMKCTICQASLTWKEVGAYTRIQNNTEFTEMVNDPETELSPDKVFTGKTYCRSCQAKPVALNLVENARNEKRQLTIEQLRLFEKLWKAKSFFEYLVPGSEKKNEPIENSKQHKSVMLNENRDKILVTFDCICCGKENTVAIPFNEPIDLKNVPAAAAQAGFYLDLPAQRQYTCIYCNNKTNVTK